MWKISLYDFELVYWIYVSEGKEGVCERSPS
jgi:hypothetical protein